MDPEIIPLPENIHALTSMDTSRKGRRYSIVGPIAERTRAKANPNDDQGTEIRFDMLQDDYMAGNKTLEEKEEFVFDSFQTVGIASLSRE